MNHIHSVTYRIGIAIAVALLALATCAHAADQRNAATKSAGSSIDPDQLKPGEFWLAPVAGETPDPRADGLFARMTKSSADDDQNAQIRAGDYSVIFVYAGEKFGNQWLTFACSGSGGLSAFTFDRREHFIIDNHLALDLARQPAWQNLKWTLLQIARSGFEIRTTIEVNGARNEVLWSVDPVIGAPPHKAGELRLESPLICCRATPLTGWFGFEQGLRGQGDPGNLRDSSPAEPEAWRALEPNEQAWYPSIGNVLFFQGPAPQRELEAATGAAAISFLSDGRIAVATPTLLRVLDVDGRRVISHGLPGETPWTEAFAFSPDGARLFMSGTSRPAWVVDTVQGRIRPFSESTAGDPSVAFPDAESMAYFDNVSAERVDWSTLVHTLLETGGVRPRPFGFGMVGKLILLAAPYARPSNTIELVNVEDKKVVRTFEELQGLHQTSLSPDARWVVMKGQSGLRIFDAKSGEMVLDHDYDFDFHTARSRIKWSADGTRGATAGSQCVYVWSLKKPYWFARFPHGRHGFWPDVALSPDGKSMAASAADSKDIAYWPNIDATLPQLASPLHKAEK